MFKQLSLGFLCIAAFATSARATSYSCATFSIPGANTTNITGINNSGALVGTYTINTSSGIVSHGFMGNASGSFTTIDYPGAASTELFTINNTGVITGKSSTGTTTGWFTVNASGVFTPVSVPAPYTLNAIYGINDNGAISAVVSTASGPTFAILNADGSVTVLPGYNGPFLVAPGSINNAPVMLETHNAFSGTQLVDPSGHITPVAIASAFGLNNLGTVVGYHGSGSNGGDLPEFGFSADSSGVVSDVLCPGQSPGFAQAITQAINDGGVIAGGTHILTPIPGQPQISLSTSSLSFPPTPVGQTSAEQQVTVSNTGTARLDIGSITTSSTEFRFSGCLDPVTGTASLDPGGSCLLFVTATPSSTGTRTGTLTSANSAPGSPGQLAMSVTGTAMPPSCAITSITSGPPAQATFTMQDKNTGLQSITVADSSNATASIPTFVSGSTSPITVTATQTDATQASHIDFQVTNVAGAATTCGSGFGGPELWTGIGQTMQGKVATWRNFADLPEVLVRGGDNSLWHAAQTAQGGSWTAWENLSGQIISNPVLANQDTILLGTYPLEVFAVGGDGALWHLKSTGGFGSDTWSAWATLGGQILGNPAVGVNKDGRLEAFVIGTDHALWHIAQTTAGGAWGDWSSLGGGILSDPTVVTYQTGPLTGCIDVFVVGGDSAVWHNFQTRPGGSWSGWQSLNGAMQGNIAAAFNSDGRAQLVVRGTDNALWTNAQTSPGGSWTGWVSMSGYLTSDPSLVLNANSELEAFARGSDYALWHIAQTSPGAGFSGWATLQGGLNSGPSAVRTDHGTLDVFVEGSDTDVWYVSQISPGVWQ